MIHCGDCLTVLRTLADQSAHCCVTSPPYFGLRDYGVDGQIGLEETPDAYVAKIVEVFREVRRVLRNDGTLWLNLGDSYAGSWGAQSRPSSNDAKSNLQGGSMLSARQIQAHPKSTHTGSLKNTPGLKPKDLIGIPWRVAFALQADGWYLRQDIIWHKPNPMPESVHDRCTKAHEYLFLLSKSERYWWDAEAMQENAKTAGSAIKMADGWDTGEGGHGAFHRQGREKGKKNGAVQSATRNRRSVWPIDEDEFEQFLQWKEEQEALRSDIWSISTRPYKGAHFATFPPKLIEPCILAGCPVGGTVLDPFFGAGTTGMVAKQHGREFVGIELNPEYLKLAEERIRATSRIQEELFR